LFISRIETIKKDLIPVFTESIYLKCYYYKNIIRFLTKKIGIRGIKEYPPSP